MSKDPQQWLKQAEYDLDTAEYMYQGGRYFYSVFMCHLAIEKALKGLYQKTINEFPPRTHSLTYLISKSVVQPPETIGKFLVKIDQASIVTRYPEDLHKLQADYNESIVKQILILTKDTIQWIKENL